jgi:3-hydroxyisobutyrate dehydrogenase-like beta-hydroxyacid dehydrogenase
MTSETSPTVTLFGLGEAGSAIATDLVAAGVEVRGFDPALVPTPAGVSRVDDPRDAVRGAGLILAVTAAGDARTAMEQAWDEIAPPTIYADLATASPVLKEELGEVAAAKGVPFVDVALMAPVPGRGLATPALACGPGSPPYAEMINGLGGRVEVIGERPGLAASRKLTRSIVTKGLTALLMESMVLAAARGDEDWAWHHLVAELTSIDEAFLLRLVGGTERHSRRRLEEMMAVRELLDAEALPSPMTDGVITVLRRVTEEGMPGDLAHPGDGLL